MSCCCDKCHCKPCCCRRHGTCHGKSGGSNLLVLGLLAFLALKGFNEPPNRNVNIINVKNQPDNFDDDYYD
jgi:hypothetical protein